MLDSLFADADYVHRLPANPLATIFDRLAEFLTTRGQRIDDIRRFIRVIDHFAYWLGTQHAAVTTELLTKVSARRFLDTHLPNCSCSRSFPRALVVARAAINHLLRMLARDDPARSLHPATPHDALLAQYHHFLRQTCGLAPQTCLCRLHFVRQFLQRCYGDAPVDFSHLRPDAFQDYFRHHTGHLKPGSITVLATALRSFLRFLAVAHGANATLAGTIPIAPNWPKDRLARTLSPAELQTLLDYFDTDNATGRRDLAMVRCMCDLGLRVGEVVALTLDDIDWHQGVLKVSAGKSRTERLLPLPRLTGAAISAYLCRGRPSSADRHLFLRHTLPVGTPLKPGLVAAVVRTAFARATGHSASIGPHVLRHTAATRMRCAGHSLKGIADVLGHRSVDTTTIYVKLDVEALRAVALPWPGGDS